MALFEHLAGATVFDLEQPRFAGMPIHPAHKPGYLYSLYRRHRDSYRPDTDGPRSGSSGILSMMEHSGTHIDALCHQACDLTLHGDIKSETVEGSAGYRALGVETIKPLLARGVLIDVARWKQVERLPLHYAITADDLEGAARSSGITINRGDVLLVRTGYGACWQDADTYLSGAGISKSGNIWVAERGAAAVGADNAAWDEMTERDPDTNMTLFGHAHLLVRHGIYIIENLNLEALASARHHEFGFVGIPLKLVGATGSPIRPLALVG